MELSYSCILKNYINILVYIALYGIMLTFLPSDNNIFLPSIIFIFIMRFIELIYRNEIKTTNMITDKINYIDYLNGIYKYQMK